MRRQVTYSHFFQTMERLTDAVTSFFRDMAASPGLVRSAAGLAASLLFSIENPGANKASDTPDNGVAEVGDKGPQVSCADPVGGPYDEPIDTKVGVLSGTLQRDGS